MSNCFGNGRLRMRKLAVDGVDLSKVVASPDKVELGS